MFHGFKKAMAVSACSLILAAVSSAVPNRISSMTATRFSGNPLITNAQAGTQYMNGSEAFQKPSWVTGTLSSYPYLMFFADHTGTAIYSASASAITGPWTIRSSSGNYPLALSDMPANTFHDHMASPDLQILDNTDDGQGFRMYWHSVYTGTDKQCSGVAYAGTDPMNFTPKVTAGEQWSNTICRFYMRVWEFRGKYYTMAKFHKVGQGELWTADTPDGPFHKVKNLIPNMRHCGIVVEGDQAIICYTQVGDAPEHIEMVTVDLSDANPANWVASDPLHILYPDMSYEGSQYSIVASVDGAAKNVRELRDPGLVKVGSTLYMFYSGNGEDNICGASLAYTWGTAPGATYAVTVNSGSGDGTYKQGDVVRITAKQPPSGQKFNGWTGNTSYLADASKQTTTLTVPSSNVTVTATYTSGSAPYHLIVHDGLGEGWYAASDTVSISPMTAPSGMSFDKWTGRDQDVGYVASQLSSSTTVTMPSADVTIAAGYWDGQTGAQAFDQKSDSNNVLVMEAENEDSNTTGSSKTWTQGTSLASYSGAGYMEVLPNSGSRTMYVHQDGYSGSWSLSNCAAMTYRCYFRQPGYHFIQIRTNNNNSNADLWFKAGLNGLPISSYDMTTNVAAAWNWAKVDYYVFKAWVYVDHCGINTFNIWSTDDGARVDKIILSTNPDYAASGTGPTESSRIGIHTGGGTTYTLTVNSGSGDGNYTQGTVATIVADTPPQGYVFSHWSGDTTYVANTNASTTTLTMPAAAQIVTAIYQTANFYTLTVNSGTGDGSYIQGTVVDIEADPCPSNQVFDQWTGNTSNVANVYDPSTTVTMPSSNVTVTATYKNSPQTAFREDDMLVSMEAENATGDVAGSGSMAGTDWVEDSSFSGASGGLVLQAMPNTGLNAGDGGTNGCRADFAVYFQNTGSYYLLIRVPAQAGSDNSLNVGYNGSILQSNVGTTAGEWRWPKLNSTVNVTSPGIYTINVWEREDGTAFDKVVLTTDPNYFLGTDDPGPNESTLLTGGAQTHSLTVNSGTGSGSYTSGTVVNISANTAPTGYQWSHWSGDTANVANTSSASTTITMPAATTIITATYTAINYTLTVNSGTGSGSYIYQQVVNISANTPPGGQMFDHWTGDTANVANTSSSSTTITMPASNPVVTALYKAIQYSLTVNSGTGSGSYTSGTVVNISANTPPTGYSWSHWSGDTANVANTSSSSTTITMPAATTIITAIYTVNSYTLTVNSGTGDGTYSYNTVVNIAADTPQSGYQFDHWTGDTATVANTSASSTTITIPAQNAVVTALYSATGGGLTFQESSGLVSMEAEHYYSKAAGTGSYTSYNWTSVTPYSSASNNEVMQAQPNNGVDAGTGTSGPVMNFQINFSTTGVYYALVRFPPLPAADNTINLGMNGSVFQSSLTQGSTSKWKWMKATNSVTVNSTGNRTFNIWMGKDGTIVDKIVLTTNASQVYDGGSTGPTESSRQ